MAVKTRTRLALATGGLLLLAASTAWADGDARKWAAIRKWSGTVKVRLTFKAAHTEGDTTTTTTVSRSLQAKVIFEIDPDKTQVEANDIVTWHSTTCQVIAEVDDEAKSSGGGTMMRESMRASGAGEDCELHLAIEAGPNRKARYTFTPPSSDVKGTMVFEITGAPAFTEAQNINVGVSRGGALLSPDNGCCEGPLPADGESITRTVTIANATAPSLGPFAIQGDAATAVIEWDLSPDGNGRPTVTLTGCTDLMTGESATAQATGKPAGGTYRWWSAPPDPISFSPLGGSASLTGGKPGTTTVHVEYTAPGGKKAEASQPGSSARVISINGGTPIPTIGLYDAKAQRLTAKRTVPLQVEPAGDLNLTFAPADYSVASVVSHGTTLELQGAQCGTTTIQGQSRCGQKAGPVATVQVVACDDDVIADLTRQRTDAQHLVSENLKAVAELLNDPAFKKADDIDVDTAKAVLDTAKVLTKVVPVGQGIKTAGKVLSAASMINKFMKDDMAGVGTSAAMQVLKTTAVGAAVDVISVVKDIAGAMSSYKQVAAEMGTIVGTGERMNELEARMNGYMQQLDVIDKRLNGTCKSCSQSAPPQPGTSGQPGQSAPPGQGSPPAQVPPGPPPPPGAPPGSGTQPPGAPPVTPPAGQTGGAQGQPAGQGGVALNLSPICEPATIKGFSENTLGGYGRTVEQHRAVLQEILTAADLPAPQRLAPFKAASAKVDAFLTASQTFDQEANDFISGSKNCSGEAKGKIGTINVKGNAATKKALLVVKPGK
jgi:hypothetical protein